MGRNAGSERTSLGVLRTMVVTPALSSLPCVHCGAALNYTSLSAVGSSWEHEFMVNETERTNTCALV